MNPDAQKRVLRDLKSRSGTHSPARREIVEAIGYDPVKHDFCFLSNPYATDLFVEAIRPALSGERLFQLIESYPASSSYVARNIATLEGIDAETMIMANGAVQAIEWVCSGWGIQRLLVPTPTFSTYYELTPGRHILQPGFFLASSRSPKELLRLARVTGCDGIVLIHPNNPTGEAMSGSDLATLIEDSGDIKIIIDESFCHFLEDYPSYRRFRSSVSRSNVAFVKSMSKDFGIAGLRLGYLQTTDPSLRQFAQLRTTWNLNTFAVAFSEVVQDAGFRKSYEGVRLKYLQDREHFYALLSALPCIEVFPSQANFFLVRVAGPWPNIAYDLLIDHGVYVRTLEDKVGLDSSYIRVACRTPDENAFFVNALSRVCKA